MTIGENIKRIRLQRGLTQNELAYLVGVNDSMIRRYELGLRNPKPEKLEKIASALGVNIEVLLNSDFDNIRSMHRLFQLFRQYDGKLDCINGKIYLSFDALDLRPWHKRFAEFENETKVALEKISVTKKKNALEDALDKFNWWMDIYPKSDSLAYPFEKQLENYRKIKDKRRTLEDKRSEEEE